MVGINERILSMKTGLKRKINQYIDAGFPILYINSFEDDKIDSMIREVGEQKEIVEWNKAKGIVDFDTKVSQLSELSELTTALDFYLDKEDLERTILVLKDIHSYINTPEVIARLKIIANLINQGVDATIIIVSTVIDIPPELEKYITILETDYLSKEEIKGLITHFIKEYEFPQVQEKLLEEFAVAFKGLSEFEIYNLLGLAYADDGELTRKHLGLIFEQKQQMIKKAGILEMIPLKESLDDIGGLENLKTWLKRKAKVFKNTGDAEKFGVDMPKGVLVAGVPGCGKSLSAKAIACLFEVPLLRLDMGRLMGKYVGESEANMRKAISLAEAISPCVLWIDELEKAFAGIGAEGNGAEVTTRLFGYFLTWLQEKTSPTFVVATANDILKLPPELSRKGRFDEIFYISLPKPAERKRIFEIHIKKRRPKDLNNIDISQLVQKTEGFSGADIEGVVKDGIESAFAAEKDRVTTEDIVQAIKETNSLMELMGDSLNELMKEYEKRKYKNSSIGSLDAS